jgi:ribose transport system substrate-binding protein
MGPFRNRRAYVIAAAGVLAVSISACTSSGTSADGGTTAAATGTTSSAPASSSASASAGGIQYTVAGAKALVAQATKLPTGVGVDQPLTNPAPRGKSIVALDSGVPNAIVITQNIADAAKVLDWKFTRIVYKPTPEGQQSAMDHAIQARPDAIVQDGMTAQILVPYVKQMKAAGIAFISEATAWKDDASTATDAIDTSVGPDVNLDSGGLQAFLVGDLTAAWAIAKTDGHVNALTVNVTDYPVLLPGVTHFEAFLKSACPSSCKDTRVNVTGADIGTNVPTMVVSALQRNPSANYINCTAGQFCIGVSAAVKAAGFNDVKIIGAYADQASVQQMRAGSTNLEAFTTFSFPVIGWRDMDAVLRVVAGEKITSPSSTGITDTSVAAWTPVFFLTKDNAPENINVAVPSNYQDLFKKMWGVS